MVQDSAGISQTSESANKLFQSFIAKNCWPPTSVETDLLHFFQSMNLFNRGNGEDQTKGGFKKNEKKIVKGKCAR